MTFCSTQFNPMLAPSTSIRNTQGPESYITACDSTVHHQSQNADLSTQPDLICDQRKNQIEQPMNVSKAVFSRSEQTSLHVNDLNHIEITPLNEAMVQGIKKTLALS